MDDLCRPALFVPMHRRGSDEEVDMSRPPTSAEEYLRRVRLEAQSCPSTVVADVDRDVFRGKQTIMFSNSTGFSPAPSGYAPAIEWQRYQAASFSELRQKLGHHRSKVASQPKSGRPTLPRLQEQGGWCIFCFGDDFWRRLRSRRGERTTEEEQENSDAIATQEAGIHKGVPPLLSIVSAMEQPMVYQLLEYHIEWLNHLGFSISQGCWLFALIACLEKPLLPEAASMLRTLARQCSALRASLETSEDQRLAPLNLLICLVARYFDQSDLADNG
ncbi:gem-associated protein 2-like [Patiria miniata]|uniref:Gem-associated protein 2 n=1 Tax=Patiria miniata TaxID=46514 RepID=A0A914AB35_PATMI|nr:gem-associated protein 2-like [Patiria miniata]XP_038060656.1 gem-associated protein 2-like [Patiria miniata]